MPSQDYAIALEESTRHHASSKTYSGRLLRPHAPFIKDIIDRLGCRSVLDYGAGKGDQYRWRCEHELGSIPVGMTIEEFWGVPVTKYDPAYPPYAKEPEGRFDLVICTHTLGSIPVSDLGWVVERLHDLAGKAVYVAEKLGLPKKKVFSNPSLFPREWSRRQWADMLRSFHRNGVELHLATRSRSEAGVRIEREIIAC